MSPLLEAVKIPFEKKFIDDEEGPGQREMGQEADAMLEELVRMSGALAGLRESDG